jgi:glycosyltransferase involved in cell wall biosynthesis
VESVIHQWIDATPFIEHGLLFVARANERTKSQFSNRLKYRREIHGRLRGLAVGLNRSIKDFSPHYIHAHSTIAGIAVRAVAPRNIPLLYSPHGYAFARPDYSIWKRQVAFATEWAMSRRRQTIVTVGCYESALARRVGGREVDVTIVPNASVATHKSRTAVTSHASANDTSMIVSVGRIAAPKDPMFFINAALRYRIHGRKGRWVWIGGGDPKMEALLRSHGIEVTGWLTSDKVLERLDDATVYVLTSSSEACPMTLLDAIALGVPVVARDIPAIAEMGLTNLVATPSDMASAVIHAEKYPDDDFFKNSRDAVHSLHNIDVQRRALSSVYVSHVDRVPEI